MLRRFGVMSKVALAFIFICFGLVVYVVIGSIDREQLRQPAYFEPLLQVNPDENAYFYLARHDLLGPDWIHRDDEQWLKSFWGERIRDLHAMSTIVNRYREAINHYKVASAKPYLQYPQPADSTDLPPYSDWFNGIRLMLLEAELYASLGEFDAAAELTQLAWSFSEKVKRMNGYLISYTVGMSSQDQVLQALLGMVNRFDFEEKLLNQFLVMLKAAPTLSEEEWQPVIQAELRFLNALLTSQIDLPLMDRWKNYRTLDFGSPDNEFSNAAFKRSVFEFMQVLIPKFYIHKNHILNLTSDEYNVVSNWSGMHCGQPKAFPEKEYEWFPEVTWLQILLPNQKAHSLSNHRDLFKGYLIRRCLSFTQVEAVKGILMARRMEISEGRRPSDYSSSVEQYPELIDYMSGGILLYSEENRWFYSVGENALDDHGESGSCYSYRCFANDLCRNNPTFPIDPYQCDWSE